MNFPENIKYTSEHEWIRVEGNEAFVGITDYAQSELGEIVFIDVPLELNEELDAAPELVNNDPYGKGWIIKISVKDASELDSLMDAAAYQASL